MRHLTRQVFFIGIGCFLVFAEMHGADRVVGKGAAGKEKVVFKDGWGLLKGGENQVYIGFTAKPISPDLEKKVLAEQSFFMGLDTSAGPAVEVVLTFKEGAKTASLKTLDYYYVAFVNFKKGPMTVNLSPTSRSGTITSLRGDLTKGGTVTVKLKGVSEGAEKTMFTWDLEASTALRAK